MRPGKAPTHAGRVYRQSHSQCHESLQTKFKTDLIFWAVIKIPNNLTSSLPSPRVEESRLDLDGVKDLPVEARDEGELGLVLAILLGFVEDLRCEMFSEKCRGLGF